MRMAGCGRLEIQNIENTNYQKVPDGHGLVGPGEDLGDDLTGGAAVEEGVLLCEEVAAREKVLGGGDHELAVAGRHQVALVAHEDQRLGPRLLRLGQVQVHLVTVEVRVVGRADALVKP